MGRKIAMAGIAVSLALSAAAWAATSEDEALASGRAAANVLVDTLRDQLSVNIKEKGAAASLPQCFYQALTVGKEVETKTGVRVKRTSFKLRNPRNAPDAFEKDVLSRFERYATESVLPTDEIRRETLDGQPVFRYVRPITVGGGCLACHAEANSLADDVKAALAEKYPEDRAVGYREGDFRGIISAVIPAE